MFSFFLCEYLWGGVLGHMIAVYLSLLEIDKSPSEVAEQVIIPTSNV